MVGSYNKEGFFMQVWIHVPMRSPEDECERHLFVDQVTQLFNITYTVMHVEGTW